MIVYKALGGLLLVISALVCADHTNKKRALSLERAEGWTALLGYVKTQVECFSLPIGEILCRCDKKLLLRCGFTSSEEPPLELSSFVESCDISDSETERLMRELASEFGRCYREEQVKRCEYYIGMLETRVGSMREQLQVKKKLTTTLWLTGSLMLVILFL